MNGTNTYEQLLDRLNWRYATRQFDPIRRTAPPTGNNRLTVRSAIFAVSSSEGNNKQKQTNAKKGNVKLRCGAMYILQFRNSNEVAQVAEFHFGRIPDRYR
jgi:hypothetical protein